MLVRLRLRTRARACVFVCVRRRMYARIELPATLHVRCGVNLRPPGGTVSDSSRHVTHLNVRINRVRAQAVIETARSGPEVNLGDCVPVSCVR